VPPLLFTDYARGPGPNSSYQGILYQRTWLHYTSGLKGDTRLLSASNQAKCGQMLERHS